MHANKIADLVKILPPPANPLDRDETVLARVKRVLSVQFPGDFLEFGRLYGSGNIYAASTWEVWSPFRPTYPLIVMKFARGFNLYRASQEVTGMPFGIFPEEGGLLPFAKSVDGTWACWVTQGQPDDWSVVDIGRYEQDGYEALDMGFSEYFYSVLTRKHILARHKTDEAWQTDAPLSFEPEVFVDQGF